MVEKYIKYNGNYTKVLSCDQCKAGIVTLKDEVKIICDSAFQDCKHIREINFPKYLEVIEENAFKDCSGLTEITIPTLVSTIGNSAFASCYNIKKVSIEGALQVIPNYCFAGCMALTEIEFSESIQKIGNSAFFNCNNLKELYFPESLEEIGDNVFEGCNNLKQLIIPSGVKKIGNFMYANNYLEEIIILTDTPPEVSELCMMCSESFEKYADLDLDSPFDDVKLVVQSEAQIQYITHPFWGKFNCIITLDD